MALDLPPHAVLLLDDVIEKIRESVRLERMDRNEPTRLERSGKAFQVNERGMPGCVDDLPRDVLVFEPCDDPLRAILFQVAFPHRIAEPGPVEYRLHAEVPHRHGPKQHDGPSMQAGQVLREYALRPVSFEVVEQLVGLDEHPLGVWNVEPHTLPIGLRDTVPTGRFKHDSGIEINR